MLKVRRDRERHRVTRNDRGTMSDKERLDILGETVRVRERH